MKIIFSGTPEFAIPAFNAILNSEHQIIAVYTQPDRPSGRGQKLTASPIKALALENKLQLLQPASLKNPEAQEQFKNLQADVLVNVAYGLLLPKEILEGTKYGCVNIHPSLLPRWRGAAPIQRAIWEGDQETGVTIMRMDEGLDTGDIYLQQNLPIENTDTSATLMAKTAEIGAQLLLEVLNQIQNGNAKHTSQDSTHTTYAKKISKEDGLINWQNSAIEIDRQIRALNPWPVAYMHIAEKIIRVWQATPLTNKTQNAPGTVISANKDGIDIATGDGILRLQKIQLPGGKCLPVSDIINAHGKLFL